MQQNDTSLILNQYTLKQYPSPIKNTISSRFETQHSTKEVALVTKRGSSQIASQGVSRKRPNAQLLSNGLHKLSERNVDMTNIAQINRTLNGTTNNSTSFYSSNLNDIGMHTSNHQLNLKRNHTQHETQNSTVSRRVNKEIGNQNESRNKHLSNYVRVMRGIAPAARVHNTKPNSNLDSNQSFKSTNRSQSNGKKWKLQNRTIHDIPISVWKRKGNIQWTTFSKYKQSQFKSGFIDPVFPTRSEMKPDVQFDSQKLWYKSMGELPRDLNFEELDEAIYSTHCSNKTEALNILSQFTSEIEILRVTFVLACKLSWNAYDVKEVLNQLSFLKIWVCEGVLRTTNDEDQSHIFNVPLMNENDILEYKQSDIIPYSFNSNQNQFKFKRHSWNVIQTWDGKDLKYFIMDVTLGRTTASYNSNSLDSNLESADLWDFINDFWFLLPSRMLRFTHFASRYSNRNILTGYNQKLPENDPLDVSQSTAEDYPQSVQEFQRGPNMTFNAIYLGIFPRNDSSRMSHQIVSNYVSLEFDSLSLKDIDIDLQVKSLDENPNKETYHIWETYPLSCRLNVHILFRTKGVYSVTLYMQFRSDESIEDNPSYQNSQLLHTYSYIFYVKKGMTKDVGGFNPSVFADNRLNDTLFRIEYPLQRYLESGSIYQFQILADPKIFSKICILLSHIEPVEVVLLNSNSNCIDVETNMKIYQGSIIIDKKKKYIHAIAFTHEDTDYKQPIHISTWEIQSQFNVIDPDLYDVNIPDTWAEIPFFTFPLNWIETKLSNDNYISDDIHENQSYLYSIDEQSSFKFQDDLIVESAMINVNLSQSTSSLKEDELTENKNEDYYTNNNLNLTLKIPNLESKTIEEKLIQILPSYLRPQPEIKESTSLERNFEEFTHTENGQYYFDIGLFEEALNEWIIAMEEDPNGDIYYQMSIAAKQLQKEQDVEKYLHFAADNGHIDSMKLIAGHYVILKDIPKAIIYLEKASELGDIEATYELATYLTSNPKVQRDLWKAFQLFKKAADFGHNDAKYITGLFYCEGIEGKLNPDYEKAYSYFFDSGELNNHAPSLTAIGWLYEHELISSDRSLYRALEYYEKAAQYGELTAMLNCGILLLQDYEELPHDEEKALMFLEMASDIGVKGIDTLKIQLRLKLEYEDELDQFRKIYEEQSKLPSIFDEINKDIHWNQDEDIPLTTNLQSIDQNLP